MLLLCVDVGNSSSVLGIFSADRLVHSWRLHTAPAATSDEIAALLFQLCKLKECDPNSIQGLVVASVVPPLRVVWQEVGGVYLRCPTMIIGPDSKVGLTLDVEHPSEVGADRIVDGLAAWRMYGAPIVVVDCGTAITVDAIGAGGAYRGGAIAPGIGIASEALFQQAALLYRVELRQPDGALGKTTAAQMRAGIMYGCAGQIDHLVDRVRMEMGGADRVVATGGFASLVIPLCKTVTVIDPWLTLHGLRLAYAALA